MSWNGPTTPWWDTPPPNPQIDPGLFYLWSPLVIFFICLAVVVVLAICGLLFCLMCNVCQFCGCCNPPGTTQRKPMTCWELCCCCCIGCFPTLPPTKVIHRHGSARIKKPRKQIIVEDLPDDDVIVVNRGGEDRKSVRICDSVRSTRSHRRPAIDIDDCAQPAPIPIIIQQVPAPAMPPPMPVMAPAPTDCQGNCGGGCGCGGRKRQRASTLNVVIGNASNTGRPNQFVMNMNTSSGGAGSYQSSEYNEYRLMPVSGGSYSNKGYEAVEHECGSCFSDGQRSAVIDIGQGHGVYPSLPQYDD